MWWCSDPLITYLKEFGYNVVRVPRADIKPLQILSYEKKDLSWLGDLSTVLVAGENISLPKMEENVEAANISGKRTGTLKIGLGLGILSTLIGAMGGVAPDLEVSYKQAKYVVFEFRDVLKDAVKLAELDQYLTDADINPFSRHVGNLLEADQVYVTTSTIKSAKFMVEARKSDGTALEVSADLMQEVVGANVRVSSERETASKLTYEGQVPLVFGIEAVHLFYDEDGYTAIKSVSAGQVAAKALESTPDDGAERLMTESPLVRLDNLNR